MSLFSIILMLLIATSYSLDQIPGTINRECNAIDSVLLLNSNIIRNEKGEIKQFLNGIVKSSHIDSSFGIMVYGDLPVIYDPNQPDDYTLLDLMQNKDEVTKITFDNFYTNNYLYPTEGTNSVDLDSALDAAQNMLNRANINKMFPELILIFDLDGKSNSLCHNYATYENTQNIFVININNHFQQQTIYDCKHDRFVDYMQIPILASMSCPNQQKVSTKGNKQIKCGNRRCCQYRNNEFVNKGINCRSLSIEECVLNDNICEWDCDLTNFSKRQRKRGNFKKFDDGNILITDIDGEIDNMNDMNLEKPQNIEDVKLRSKFYEYDVECGAVYEYEISSKDAEKRLNNNKPKRQTLVSKGNIFKHIKDEELKRRLTILIGEDGRQEIGAEYSSTFPYYVGGKLGIGCTGTLISKRVLITAAHCLYDTVNNGWKSIVYFIPNVVERADFIAANGYRINTQSFYVPSEFINTGSAAYDYGLVRLQTTDTNLGYMAFGYDETMSAPIQLETFAYPGDYGGFTRIHQLCTHNFVANLGIFSTDYNINGVIGDCDGDKGESGAAIYKNNIIYATTQGSKTINGRRRIIRRRIDPYEFDVLCDFISEGEDTIEGCIDE